MVTFDEDAQNLRIERLHKEEQEGLAKILSEKYGLPYLDLSITAINTDALRLVPEDEARESKLAAFNMVNKALDVAVLSPQSEITKASIGRLTERGFTAKLFMVSESSLESAWKRYKDLSFASVQKEGVLDISSDEISRLAKDVKTLSDAKKSVEETLSLKKSYRVSRVVEIFLATGIALRASDIHIEPEEDHVRLRFRLDGILTDVLMFDRETYELLLSRIKLLSGLKLNVKKDAQDGRFSIVLKEIEIEIRTSTLPGAYGESIVMRILNPETISVPFEELGMERDLFDAIDRELSRPNGMILTTGPTGSGKTTTLYAFLKRSLTSEVKIITIEDPIEYHLEGIVQTQTNDQEGYTFSQGLRSALRQDPDIIMVGEIRDRETAEIAIHASLTGHLVFSTLHTNSAAGAFPRLTDLGVDPKVMLSAVNISLAQRLVRKLCPSCKKSVRLEGKKLAVVKSVLASIVKKEKVVSADSVYEPGTCDVCMGTGYRGRLGVFEAVRVESGVEEIIRSSGGERDVAVAAAHQGFLTMLQDGVLKVLSGTTSLAEVARVVDLDLR